MFPQFKVHENDLMASIHWLELSDALNVLICMYFLLKQHKGILH